MRNDFRARKPAARQPPPVSIIARAPSFALSSASTYRTRGWMTRTKTAIATTLAIVLGGSALCASPYWGSAAFSNQYDDAYISYRYAIQLASGNGLVYNIGERIDSASSLLHVLALALAYRLGAHDLERVAAGIGVLAAGATAAVVYWGALGLGKSRILALFLAAITSVHGLISGWAVSGMEAVPYAFFVSLFVFLFFVKGSRGWGVVAALLAAFFTRMEGVLLILAWGMILLVELRAPERRRRALLQMATVGAAVAGFALFKRVYYGSFVSGALAFKDVWGAYQPRPAELLATWETTAVGFVLLGFGGIAFVGDRKAKLALFVYLALSIAALLTGPRSGWGRYSVHLLPVFAMLAAAVFARLKGELRPFGVMIAALVAWQAYDSMDDMRTFIEKVAVHQHCRKQVGGWIAANHPSAVVLSSDIGAIAYAASHTPFIDAVGLTSPDILDAYLHGGDLDRVLASKRPELVADTYYAKGAYGQYQSLKVLAKPAPNLKGVAKMPAPSRSYFESERLFQCKSADGLLFAVGRLSRRP